MQFRETLTVLRAATDATRSSSGLRRALQSALAVGNFINSSTPRGRAWGFKLETLAKLAEAKGADRRTTLIDVLVRLPGGASLAVIPDELAILGAARALSFDEVSKIMIAFWCW
jgi:hypothetical protein